MGDGIIPCSPEFRDALNEAVAKIEAERMDDLRALVDKQARDEGLWFRAETAPEAYLQQELRKLHPRSRRKCAT